MRTALTVLFGSLVNWARQWAARQLHQKRRVGRWLSRAAAGMALCGVGAQLATD